MAAIGAVQVPTKKNKQNVKFFLDKVQCTWALQAKSEINLELYRHQRLFWNMANLWMFRTRKSNSSTLRGCRAALHEVGDLAIIGKDFSITILIKNEPKLEKLIGRLGNFSCLVLAWHVKTFENFYILVHLNFQDRRKKSLVCFLPLYIYTKGQIMCNLLFSAKTLLV